MWVLLSNKYPLSGTYSQTTLVKTPWTSLLTFLRLTVSIWQMGEKILSSVSFVAVLRIQDRNSQSLYD